MEDGTTMKQIAAPSNDNSNFKTQHYNVKSSAKKHFGLFNTRLHVTRLLTRCVLCLSHHLRFICAPYRTLGKLIC